MAGDDIRDEIARLEERIETLRESIARCRKISLGSKIAIAAGFAWLALTLLLLAPFVPSLFFGAIAAVIGGVVLLGSNATTWNETEAALRQAEMQRTGLIDRIELRVVDESAKRLH
jgi:membrane glycosyltransferase